MRTYTTSTGRVLDLVTLTPTEEAYFEKAVTAFRAGIPWAEFCKLTQSPENPALEAGRATVLSIENPLFIAILDMECRLGVAQGFLRAQGEFVAVDPLEDEDLSIVRAAAERSVSRQTLYNAIRSGELIATKKRPVRISRNSLQRWAQPASRHRRQVFTVTGTGRIPGPAVGRRE